MELPELEQRLIPFCRHHYKDDQASVSNVFVMPGHAGFAYGFSVQSGNNVDAWFLRLPPPNVNWRGTADVLRQVQILNALDGTDIPHCSVKWSGDDLQWFGRPYFIVPQLQGDVLRIGKGEWAEHLPHSEQLAMAKQIMQALADIHQINWQQAVPKLGPAIPFSEDVTRWDRFIEKAADPDRLSRVPEARELLLNNIPTNAPVGIFHGDFQIANLFFSSEQKLQAVIDWELVGIGATLNDLGWICTFSDKNAWADDSRPMFLDPDTLISLYVKAYGKPVPELDWFRALAAYKFAIITGFNLSLHRRGKRDDPTWEITKDSMRPLVQRAIELLGKK